MLRGVVYDFISQTTPLNRVLDGAHKIVTFNNSFHGRTLATVAATAQPFYQEPFLPLPQNFLNIPFNDFDAFKKVVNSENVCVVLK